MGQYTPRPYPPFKPWFLIGFAICAVFIWILNPLYGIVFVFICAPFLIYHMLCFVIDWLGAWGDHKWGSELWARDRADIPCNVHLYSDEDPACPYLHSDQFGRTV